jgi:hypothetical protein
MTTDESTPPEPDEEEEARLLDEAVVVRGGLSTAETLSKTALAHYDVYDEYAVSVRSAPGMTADELAYVKPPLPQQNLRETTVGALRQAGFDVVRDEPPPKHALIMLEPVPTDDDYLRITAIFGTPRANPAYQKEDR